MDIYKEVNEMWISYCIIASVYSRLTNRNWDINALIDKKNKLEDTLRELSEESPEKMKICLDQLMNDIEKEVLNKFPKGIMEIYDILYNFYDESIIFMRDM